MVTKNGKPAARITAQSVDRKHDPKRRTAREDLIKSLRKKQPTGHRVGKITEDDKYGSDPE